jgi:hypothetical protein
VSALKAINPFVLAGNVAPAGEANANMAAAVAIAAPISRRGRRMLHAAGVSTMLCSFRILGRGPSWRASWR